MDVLGKALLQEGNVELNGSGTGFPSGKQLAVHTQHGHHHNELGGNRNHCRSLRLSAASPLHPCSAALWPQGMAPTAGPG